MIGTYLKERWHIAAALILSILFILLSLSLFGDDVSDDMHISNVLDGNPNFNYFVGISDTDYPPLLIYDGDIPIGFDIELITWIADERGIDITFIPIPWDNIFDALRSGEIHMITSGASITPERMEEFLFSHPYLSIEQQIAVPKDSPLTLKDFYSGEKRIGVEAGTTSEDIIHDLLIKSGVITSSHIHAVGGIAEGARSLQDGEVGFIIVDQPIMAALALEYPLKIIGSISTGEEYGIVFRKDSESLQQTINTGLRNLMDSPAWESLKAKYNINPWESDINKRTPVGH